MMRSDLMVSSLCLFVLFILFAWIHMDIMIESNKKFKVNLCVLMTAITIIAEMGCTLTDNTIPEYRYYSILFNMIGFALTPFILLVEAEFYELRISKNRLVYMPALINMMTVILSPLNGWIFYVSPSNHYYRGEFFNIYLFAFFFSILYSLYKKFKYVIQLPSYFYAKSFFSNLFIFPGFLLQVVFPQYKTTWILMTFYLIFYYVFSSQIATLLDGLTGLLNRNAFNQQLKALKNTTHPSITFVMIDIDHFKEINDTKGHPYGDECIQEVSNLLKEIFKSKDKVFRYGGDEFIVLVNDGSENKIQEKLLLLENGIKNRQENYYFPNISYGYAIYKQGQTLEEVVGCADQSMYLNKRSKSKQ